MLVELHLNWAVRSVFHSNRAVVVALELNGVSEMLRWHPVVFPDDLKSTYFFIRSVRSRIEQLICFIVVDDGLESDHVSVLLLATLRLPIQRDCDIADCGR